MTWTWTCRSVWPASRPMLTPMLYPVGWSVRSIRSRAEPDQAKDVGDLVRRQVEDVRDMPPRDGERVARRDRIGIEDGEGVLAGLHDPIGRHRAERAGIRARVAHNTRRSPSRSGRGRWPGPRR